MGICLDLGHARIDPHGGDVVEAIEVDAGHLLAIDVHDNRGRSDDHLVPFDGAIDWPAALTAVQKVGYDGALTFELSTRGSTEGSAGSGTAGTNPDGQTDGRQVTQPYACLHRRHRQA